MPVRSSHNPVPIRQAPLPVAAHNNHASSSPTSSQENPTFAIDDIAAQETTSHEVVSNDIAIPAFPLPDKNALGLKRHLVEFIDQEDLSYKPIDKASRLTYVGLYSPYL